MNVGEAVGEDRGAINALYGNAFDEAEAAQVAGLALALLTAPSQPRGLSLLGE